MSDYLSHLAERSFTPVRQVQPQMPTIFEPASVAKGVADPAKTEVVTESSGTAPNSASHLETREMNYAFPKQPVPAIPQKKQRPLQNSDAELPNPKHTIETSASNLPDNSPPEIYPLKSSRSEFQPLARNEPVVPSVVVAAEKKPDAEKRNITEKKSKAVHSLEEFSSSPPVQAKIENIFVQTSDRDITTLIHPVAAISPVREPVAYKNSGLAGKESRRPWPAADHAPVPDINITIGRIEVRATSPPAVLKSKGKREPELSLETYLERRSAGGRR